MTSTRFYQPELPLAEASLAEHQRLTGHVPLLYQNRSTGEPQWVCTHRDEINGNCFASWPPPTERELHYEKAMLGLLQTGTFKVGDMTVSYLPDDEADKLQGLIVRGHN